MHRGTVPIVLAAFLLAPAAATAQSEWEQQVTDQIRVAGEVFSADGYVMSGITYTGSLKDEASEDLSVELEGGVSYFLVGACDNDCPDIDLMLLDGSGNEIDSDYETDAVPMLEITPSRTAQY